MGQERELLIQLKDVDVAKGDNLILSGISLELYKGEFLYLMGRVGSGKTSVIKTIIGEIPLKSGSGVVSGYQLEKIRAKEIPLLRRKIGVVFQDFQLLYDRSVYKNLHFVLSATGRRDKREIDNIIRERLNSVNMLTKSHKMPHQLSGGEQQRVAIARALLNNPEIILADEPTGNLDEETAEEIMELLLKVHKEYQPAVILVTHNRELFKRYPGRVVICENMGLKELNSEAEINLIELFDW